MHGLRVLSVNALRSRFGARPPFGRNCFDALFSDMDLSATIMVDHPGAAQLLTPEGLALPQDRTSASIDSSDRHQR